MRYFYFFFFLTLNSFAENNLVQVPDSCLEKTISPCLIKAKSNVKALWNRSINIDLVPNALVEVLVNDGVVRIDVISGSTKIQSRQIYKIFGYEVKTAHDQYVTVDGRQVDLLDTHSLDLKTFLLEKNHISKDRSFVLHKSQFMNRSEIVHFLAEFYPQASALKTVLSQISKSYQKKLLSASHQQAEFLKKKQDREIASIELEEKKRIEEQIQQEKDRKRSRELFFMRTFKQ